MIWLVEMVGTNALHPVLVATLSFCVSAASEEAAMSEARRQCCLWHFRTSSVLGCRLVRGMEGGCEGGA